MPSLDRRATIAGIGATLFIGSDAGRLAAVAHQSGAIAALPVTEFGARPEAADNSDAFDRAIRAAAVRRVGVHVPPGRYRVREVRLRDGLRFIDGPGWLVGTARAPEGVITTGDLGGSAPVRAVRISTRIDCNHIARRGIFAISLQDSEISGCEVVNLSENGGDAIRLNFPSAIRNRITNNRITLATSGRFTEGLFGIHVVGETASPTGGLELHGRPALVPVTTRDNRVTGNQIVGGTHGVAFFGTHDFVCSDNDLRGQIHRNIIAGPTCSGGVIENNRCMEAGSSAVHLALGSDNVRIARNIIRSSRVSASEDDDGAIQAYAWCTNVRIVDNDIAGDWRYGIYLALVRDVQVTGNRINSTGFQSAAIAVESGWLTTLPTEARLSRARAAYPILLDTSDVLVENNEITGEAAAISLVQVGDRALRRVRMLNNRIEGAATDIAAVEQRSGALADLELSGLDTGGRAPRLQLPRGRGHFGRMDGVVIR